MSALVPVGRCPACGQPVPGTTDRRYMLCKVRVNLHQHPSVPGWCIGSWSLGRAEQGPSVTNTVIPPAWFVDRFNANSVGPYRSALDPMVMMAWEFARPKPSDLKSLTLLTGI